MQQVGKVDIRIRKTKKNKKKKRRKTDSSVSLSRMSTDKTSESHSSDNDNDDDGDGVEMRSVVSPKDAFKKGDKDASRVAHDFTVREVGGEEEHKKAGKYLKPMIYGALDGIITTFAVVAGVVGGNLAVEVVIVLGFANLLADGLSMGMGDTLSSLAENDYVRLEYEREMWETDNYLEGEQREMIELYEAKGMSHEDASAVVLTMSKYKKIFVDTMMVEELELMPPDDDKWEPYKSGAITFGSFLLFGSIPLIFYVVTIAVNIDDASGFEWLTFVLASIVTGMTMFTLGALKTRFTAEPWWRGGALMLFNGALAAAASYLISYVLSIIVGAQDVCG
jgi:vacuolar iron transporter family protein